jgi:hypothetical protein
VNRKQTFSWLICAAKAERFWRLGWGDFGINKHEQRIDLDGMSNYITKQLFVR